MAKLRFDNITLSQFNNFKLIPKKRKVSVNVDKKLTKLVRGLCYKENDTFKIVINVRNLKPDIIDNNQPDMLNLEFTEESYELKGVTSVFDRNPDKNGKYCRYVRSESRAKFFPGNQEKYVPFCNNWICSGYIIRRNSKLMFDFVECIAPDGYTAFTTTEDD